MIKSLFVWLTKSCFCFAQDKGAIGAWNIYDGANLLCVCACVIKHGFSVDAFKALHFVGNLIIAQAGSI